ncbi:RteC domain-containing protein [Sphingobacterium sp. DR205]|uniref:RteC domain-containing protein n=1 Tax=Sphingobacterium sp. DR205 TaxID=2713573 RepID=UPI0013E4BE5A|nr:RteC domain-containing protein [Sphingobacterium sp. DR205]QIH34460.1 tetracycline regulation of excision, RteC [Sphingobacterium sp. DR205]
MIESIYKTFVKRIENQEQNITLNKEKVIEEAYQMTIVLKELLNEAKNQVFERGFKDKNEEIVYFKNIKPLILGRLIFYNKVYRIETSCPAKGGDIYIRYFEEEQEKLNYEFKERFIDSDFFRYIKSGRTDLDEKYFRLGQIDILEGLNSYVFEIDPQSSTYYDYKVAHIHADELLYNYIQRRLNPEDNYEVLLQVGEAKDILWTHTKNALIELIYALHAADAISHGKLGIRKISGVFQMLFGISLNDLHNSFHRMKARSGSRTLFIDQLKHTLEEYMDKEDSF